ncbi:nucleotidyltransferase domain-containing protein [bacterium]|nr:nucleotidyltransferase domain-containing protein [bacterium]
MITEKDKAIILEYAKKYNVSFLYLFGSSLDDNDEANDIDLAVKGIMPKLFFKFYGELLRNLSKPVDLIDLSKKSLFNQIVERKAVKIYG